MALDADAAEDTCSILLNLSFKQAPVKSRIFFCGQSGVVSHKSAVWGEM
jgi:hypothetical protein